LGLAFDCTHLLLFTENTPPPPFYRLTKSLSRFKISEFTFGRGEETCYTILSTPRKGLPTFFYTCLFDVSVDDVEGVNSRPLNEDFRSRYGCLKDLPWTSLLLFQTCLGLPSSFLAREERRDKPFFFKDLAHRATLPSLDSPLFPSASSLGAAYW